MSRPQKDEEEASAFHAIIFGIERLAILAKNRALREKIGVYMFGLQPQKLLCAGRAAERDSAFREIRVATFHQLSTCMGGPAAQPIGERADIAVGDSYPLTT